MGKFFDALDKYKVGLIAALATYVFVFIYLKMRSHVQYYPITSFHDASHVEIPEEEIALRPENIMLPPDMQMVEVKNMARDANDQRERSYDDYYENQPSDYTDTDLAALEEQMRQESGGNVDRARIQEMMEERHKREEEAKRAAEKNNKPAKTGGDRAYAGNVMVEWVLSSRSPHQKNNWYVRNPGYTCGKGAQGKVTVMIKVNQNGNVISATYDQAQSSGANTCMIDQAKKYAMMSRFSYSGSAPKAQTGRITYTFISQ